LGADCFFGAGFFAGRFLGADCFFGASSTFALPNPLDGLRRVAFAPDPLGFGLIYQRKGDTGRR